MVQKPLYDVTKSFDYNLEQGPFFDGPLPVRIIPDRSTWRKIFDYEVMSPVGLAACPIGARARGIVLASRLGFDIITHKTIRSQAVAAHPWPNLALLEPFKNMAELSITNSIGNASCELDWHSEQIAASRASLLSGQLLLVSIFGTEVAGRTVVQDFAYLAARACEAGAQVVELNFSCPNADHGILFHDAAFSFKITKAVAAVAGSIPVVVKVGLFVNLKQMRNFLIGIGRAGARGIVGINTVPWRVLNDDGKPYFGALREISGISGAPIFDSACAWVQDVAQLNAQEKLNMTIFGIGGITQPEQFDVFLSHGADVALTATGALWDPYLADKYHQGNQYENAIQSNESRRASHRTL